MPDTSIFRLAIPQREVPLCNQFGSEASTLAFSFEIKGVSLLVTPATEVACEKVEGSNFSACYKQPNKHMFVRLSKVP